MKKQQKHIPQFKLTEDASTGVLIAPMHEGIKAGHNITDAHRDDHYSLMFAFTGHYHLKIDFEDLIATAPFVLKIAPGQVHQLIKSSDHSGWVLAIEEFVLEPELQHYLLTGLSHPILLQDAHDLLTRIQAVMKLAFDLQSHSPDVFTQKSILFLVHALFCLLMSAAENKELSDAKETRGHITEQAFLQLLKKHFKDWKKPGQYASALSITTSHLNDILRETTGLSTSMHIQHHIILEAKRLLYFTDLEVREIAFKLGYDDGVYFGKLFKKVTHYTCLEFRKQFRD
ncbi:AraC family transcriptional regulator [Chitinophaga pinensis]|uniref:Transcriptional regulator, AraC family n=1 Tax=Chitinophaga pinensis (strain ATCC 43595 / DSM 2588 / LMG 13176 / NBRC 15968 / NCIMB 11800 / UQM 2034) TaxID=485918 RepID=A0A979GXK3_CHIPD|nr:helix-turn-helix domain-containing protein [Chitinophaga pinensis]ACU61235.1 transcriptional regulator, AraC family [Chitinophaga pinensis DSM 2588]